MTLVDEAGRIAVVRRYDVLDTPPDGAFDRITALAAQIFDVPISIVSIVDIDRIWFKSAHGLDVPEIPRDPGLCASAILGSGRYVLPDAAKDPHALANPLVAGEFGLRFYAAIPLTTDDGFNLGTLCVIDREPRTPTEEQLVSLEHLAAVVMDELELRMDARRAVAREAGLRRAAEDARERAEELAATLQATLLPPSLPDIPGLDVATAFRPAGGALIGGDFYDLFPLSGGWAVAIGDVCGKGAPAAALTARARHSLRAAAVDHPSPGGVLAVVNESLLLGAAEDDGTFCTLVFARLVPDGGGGFDLTIARGGHPAPLLVADGVEPRAIGGDGPLVGAFSGMTYEETRHHLSVGDTVVVFTDGLTEAPLGTGTGRLGEDGVRRILADRDWRSAADLVDAIERAFAESGARQRDDLALVVFRVVPGAS